MLLIVSIVSVIVVGSIGYWSGRNALRQAGFAEMTQAREARAGDLNRLFETLLDSLVIYTRGSTAVDAAAAFTSAFEELAAASLTPEQDASLRAYYDDVFLPLLALNEGGEIDIDGFLPDEAAARYLQALYTAPFADSVDAIALDDANDGSAWSEVHGRYHDFFREVAIRFDYDDVLMLDTEGNVIYSAYKGVDLGTNVRTGPYRGTVLAAGFEQAMNSNTVDFTVVTEFERYQPSYGEPEAWAISPIGQEGDIAGALAVQVPTRSINAVMTGDEDWSADGLGSTGEVFVVGQDRLMRSVARALVEDPEQFRRESLDAGVPGTVVDEMLRLGDSILLQPVDTDAVERALRGETGTAIDSGYLGGESLVAYAPLALGDLSWAIVARMDADEAFAPVTDFTRTLALSAAVIILVVCLASLVMAQTFVRPLRRLLGGVRQVAAGDLDTQVDAHSNDEFGDLATAFNDMARSLRTKAELLDEQGRENDRLLRSLMPEAIVNRYRSGDETIAQDHREVAVIFADLVGFEEFSVGLSSEESLAVLNGLVRTFDEAAARFGVDKVRVLRNGYLASCGLVTPHLDNIRPVLDFAQAMHAIVARFDAARGADLALRAGIDAGVVTSGLVGPSNVVYDMWGDAVDLAYRARTTDGRPGIYVTSAVYDRVRGLYRFEEVGTMETASRRSLVWRLRTEDDHG